MLDFHNALIRPTCGRPGLDSRRDVVLLRRFRFGEPGEPGEIGESGKGCDEGATWETVPIIIANMAVTGKIEIASNKDVLYSGISVALHKYYSPKEIMNILSSISNFWVTFGLKEDLSVLREAAVYTEPWALWEYLKLPGAKICLDIANGYIDCFTKRIKEFRENFPKAIIMAGNICTPEGADVVFKAGADIVKVGIGPGKLCKTRSVTGVGFPQLQAVVEIRRWLEENKEAERGMIQIENKDTGAKHQWENKYICADGGIYEPGDACKAFVAGADFVMLGSYFIGAEEIGLNGYGMASSEALKRHGEDVAWRASEGISKEFESKGSIEQLLKQLLGGIRSCCTYTNSASIEELKKAELIKIN